MHGTDLNDAQTLHKTTQNVVTREDQLNLLRAFGDTTGEIDVKKMLSEAGTFIFDLIRFLFLFSSTIYLSILLTNYLTI